MTTVAGRAMDARIREKVMGREFNTRFECPNCRGSHFGSQFDTTLTTIIGRSCHDEFGGGCRWTGSDDDTVCFDPHYSTDIAAAWLIVERLRELRRGEEGLRQVFALAYCYTAAQVAEAICRFALELYGVD